MIKIMMKDGSEYEVDYSNTTEFIEKFLSDKLDSSRLLPCKIVKLKDGVSINLSSISSIEDEEYINGIDTLIP
ncbi:hypothetical protein [Paraclostridium bifermentans]|uniref:hypothetical protein n=1 Tax=Paraclostridium bifermentans TaxID=1490 RepID=UPI0018AB07D9|nr:hypothetical protein [Paraclostridium bifermentans]